MQEMNLPQMLDYAIAFHKLGRLEEAENLYARIIETDETHFAARHMLGVVRLQQDRNAEAIVLIGDALKIDPDASEALFHYACALEAMGRAPDALSGYEKVLAAKPGHANALNNRGNVLGALNRPLEALESYDKALAIKPDYVEALYNRGIALQGLNRHLEALENYDRILALRPDFLDALYNRGTALQKLKRPREALESYDRALALQPDFMPAINNRGAVLQDLKRFEEALACLDRALAIDPRHVDTLNNRGVALLNLRHPEQAVAVFGKALTLKPDCVEALYNRGTALLDLGCLEESLASYERALAVDPDHAEILFNRGAALLRLERFEESAASYERALAANPDHPYALGAYANAAFNLCNLSQAGKIAEKIKIGVTAGNSVIPPFVLLGCHDDGALQFQCAARCIQDKVPILPSPLWDGRGYGHERIRIAYLSSDFCRHPVGYQMAELLEGHDRARFEVIGVSTGADDGSAIRARLVRAFDHFHEVRMRGDREVAELLRRLEADIVVDLNGHTQGSRPEILSHRPAPVQVNYLGYPGTMGAGFMDYVIADAEVLPFDRQLFYAEKIVHLPDSYWVSDGGRAIAEKAPTRIEAGLPAQGFVFCSFNNHWKIDAPVFDVWMRLLAQVPGSVLWLKQAGAGATGNLRREASARGIDPGRLVFAGRVELDVHLARHRLADLFLDTLPYNAHATASDALWAGLPLLTCRGEGFAGRVAASLLQAVGLAELVTQNLKDYESLALRLADDAALLQSLRRKLEANRATHALFDTARFRRNLESAYFTMWETAERGEAPKSFAVKPLA